MSHKSRTKIFLKLTYITVCFVEPWRFLIYIFCTAAFCYFFVNITWLHKFYLYEYTICINKVRHNKRPVFQDGRIMINRVFPKLFWRRVTGSLFIEIRRPTWQMLGSKWKKMGTRMHDFWGQRKLNYMYINLVIKGNKSTSKHSYMVLHWWKYWNLQSYFSTKLTNTPPFLAILLRAPPTPPPPPPMAYDIYHKRHEVYLSPTWYTTYLYIKVP